MNKQFFAFSSPIESFFKISGDDVCLYWKNRQSQFYGADDFLASFAGFTTQSIIDKTDYDMTLHTQAADLIVANDQKIIQQACTKMFLESIDGFKSHPKPVTALSLKAPLYDSRGDIAGVFGISYTLTSDHP